ncbi:xanthine/uracil permease [Ameyamaea chiangmaiensis NBRC 103196]|uniref:Pyrimidine utilization transport protein G n=1 Tax=Ameyamaea chiangmaiensis TaxID=442969 RepID=A0A850PCZ7_9PROT|nr:solute carrier family 23 protein [Ameyamaea chiangmaiensis]MBS4075629.1 pyrimidine utilization transport protein G [Ameyamaea chiangmaiensis]NVN40380.1 pyrimidine utilization transport protein G [Ameyamaea chiangmaiensis]GBQ70706.1 xanthine/uracil permease [Ameyamaea chiangmaiensis NBRC 103196]
MGRWFPVWRRADGHGAVAVDEHPGGWQSLAMGGQHLMAMTGSNVIGPLLMGFDPNVALLCSGLGTLLFFVVTAGRVPSYLGSSFSFITLAVALTGYSGHGPNPDIGLACGGIFAAGVLYALIGLVVIVTGAGWIERLMPPAVTGAIGAAIGLNLAPVATRGLGHGDMGTVCGLFALLCMAGFAIHRSVVVRRLSILLALVLSSALYVVIANGLALAPAVDFAAIGQAPLLGLPHFATPRFAPGAMIFMAPVAIVLVAENLGHLKAIGAMAGAPLDRLAGRAFLGDGLATMLAASLGGTGVTTYVENLGVMAVSRVYSTLVFAVAGGLAVLLSFSPLFGALLAAIPAPVVGGLALGLFGLIAATMVRVWIESRVDFSTPATLFPVGVALVAGAGDFTVQIGGITLGGIVTASLAAIILNRILAPRAARETTR